MKAAADFAKMIISDAEDGIAEYDFGLDMIYGMC